MISSFLVRYSVPFGSSDPHPSELGALHRLLGSMLSDLATYRVRLLSPHGEYPFRRPGSQLAQRCPDC